MKSPRSGDSIHECIPRGIRGELETRALNHPTWADYQNQWGLLLLIQGRTAEALDVFSKCLDINPRYAWAAINRVQAMALAGHGVEAAEALALAPEPAPGVRSFVGGFLALLDSDTTRGLGQLADLPVNLADRPDVVRLRSALRYAEDRDKGIASWQALMGEYKEITAGWVVPWDEEESVNPRLVTFVPGVHQLFLEASHLAAQRGSMRAAEELVDLVRLFWWDEAVHLSQHGFLADLAGKTDRAVELYERALQCDPESPRAHIALAYHWSSVGEIDESRRVLSEALNRAPHYADLHYQMGLLQRARLESPEAIDSFRRALAINPKYTMAHMQKAAVLFQTGDWEGCRAAYLKVLDSGLESGDIYLQLGQAEAELNRLDEAKEAFAMAAQLTPDEPLVHYLQGKLFQGRGDREGALKAWARFLELEGHPEKHAEVADAMEQDERTPTRRKRTGS